MTVTLLAFMLLAAADQAAAPIVREAPVAPAMVDRAPSPADDNPMLMNTGAHIKAVCGDREDTAKRLVCLSWLNGASQGNGWFKTLNPVLLPDYCPPSLEFDLARYRDVILAWLDANPRELNAPAIMVHRMALAAAYPCKEG